MRLLGGRADDLPPAGQDWAERLADRLGAFDAIRLEAALQSTRRVTPRSRPAAADLAPLRAALARLRSELARGIAVPDPAGDTDGLPPGTAGAADTEADFGPWRAHCLEQQRRMETRIGTLRTRARRALDAASADLARLAALDEALEQTVGARLQAALAAVPRQLSARFEELRRANAGAESTWPKDFADEVRRVLLAELDLRLEPVVGMIEAYGREAGESR